MRSNTSDLASPASATALAPGRHDRSVTRRAVGFVLVGGALLGSVGTATSYAPASASPPALGGLRVAAGAITLLSVMPWFGGSRRRVLSLIRRPRLWVLAACTAAFQPLFLEAVDRSGVGISALLAVGAIPVFAGAISWATLGHRPTLAWIAATAVAVGGLAIRSWGGLHGGDALGIVFALVAALSVSCYVVAATVELERGTSAVELSAGAYVLAAIFLAPLVVREPLAWAASPSGLAVIAYLGVFTMGVGNLLQMYGMRHLRPGPAATLLLSDPLVATLLGVVILHESLGISGTIGVVLVTAGLVLQARTVPTGDEPMVTSPL